MNCLVIYLIRQFSLVKTIYFFSSKCQIIFQKILLFLFCSQGLDEISYGGRRSRRGSISDTTTNTYSYASRRGSISTSVDYAALIAATNTVECATSNHQNNISKNEKHIVDQNIHPESGLGNSPKSINLSRQNSTRCVKIFV